jgi:hypothetical protein
MVTALVTCFFFSCSTDNLTAPESNQTTLRSEQNDSKGDANRICDWTDWGEDHNACMVCLDDSLQYGFPNRFSNIEDYLDWAYDLLGDYMIVIQGYSSSDVENARTAFDSDWDEEDYPLSESFFDGMVDELEEEDLIGSDEVAYFKRWKDIQENYTANLSVLEDSITDWKCDVIAVGDWDQEDPLILSFTSIACYSNYHWLNVVFEKTDPIYPADELFNCEDNRGADEIDTEAYWSFFCSNYSNQHYKDPLGNVDLERLHNAAYAWGVYASGGWCSSGIWLYYQD